MNSLGFLIVLALVYLAFWLGHVWERSRWRYRIAQAAARKRAFGGGDRL